jgi:hypothetical protein
VRFSGKSPKGEFWYFGYWEIKKAEVLDISTQGVLKPEIILRERIMVVLKAVGKFLKDLWIQVR